MRIHAHMNLCAALASAMLCATPAFAADNTDPNAGAAVPTALPVPQQNRGVTYITGGIGEEERTRIEQSKKDYNLHITSADTTGAFAGNSNLAITDKNGTIVLEAVAGPLFYAKLPAGSYTIDATMSGQKLSKKITVPSENGSTVDLKWRPL